MQWSSTEWKNNRDGEGFSRHAQHHASVMSFNLLLLWTVNSSLIDLWKPADIVTLRATLCICFQAAPPCSPKQTNSFGVFGGSCRGAGLRRRLWHIQILSGSGAACWVDDKAEVVRKTDPVPPGGAGGLKLPVWGQSHSVPWDAVSFLPSHVKPDQPPTLKPCPSPPTLMLWCLAKANTKLLEPLTWVPMVTAHSPGLGDLDL